MKLLSKDSLFSLFFALWVYIMLLFRFGYVFGWQDQIELLPYVQWLNDKSLYSNDLFIQSLAQMSFHERTIAANLMLPFMDRLELFCFGLHFLSTIFLVWALERWLKSFSLNKYIVRLGILLALVRYPEMVWGEDELYYPLFQTSLLAATLVSWALVFFSERKYYLSAILFSFSGILHPMETLIPFLWVITVGLYLKRNNQMSSLLLVRVVLIYFVGAGIVTVILALAKSNFYAGETDFLRTLFIDWRHPHHYLLQAQYNRKLIGFILFYVCGFMYYFFCKNRLFIYVWVGGAILLAYILITLSGLSTSLILLQAFKITKWLQIVGAVAVFGLLFKVFDLSKYGKILIISFSFMLVLYLYFFSNNVFRTAPFDICNIKNSTEKDISLKAAILTDKDAVFVTPPHFTAFKFFSKRSTYVDFKANPKREDLIKEWYNRISMVYNISLANQEKGFGLLKPAQANWIVFSENRISEFKKMGITHVVLYSSTKLTMYKPIYKNREYALYKL